jgi:hypothetical protein
MSKTLSRRNLFTFGALSSAALLMPAWAAARKLKTVLVEQTYLKAKPDLRNDLIRYIELNWFAMDQKGIDAGIFTFYELFEDIDENKAWDIVMLVGYPTLEGYEETKTKTIFKDISSKHTEIPVNNRSLKELGEIVEHRRLRIRPGSGKLSR